MNELYPIIRRVRRPLVPLVEGAAGGADAKPAESAKAPAIEPEVLADNNQGNGEKSHVNPVQK
jgi:hypothetical protein